MNRLVKYTSCTLICAALFLTMFGCGKSGGGGSSSSSAPAYSGSASVSGTATASGADAASVSGGTSGSSSLISSAALVNLQESMSSKKLSALLSAAGSTSGLSVANAGGSVLNSISGGTAYLYAIASDGSLIDTGFRATLDGSGNYSFPGIKTDESYVVRIIKEGTDSNGQTNVLRLESMFRLDSGDVTANCDVDIVEKMVMGFVLDEIIKYAQTTKINKRKLRKLQDAIYDAVIEMAQQGIITIPSAVMTKEEYLAATSLLSDAFKAVLNQLKTAKTVKRASKEAQTEAKVSTLSSLSDNDLKIFFADLMGFGAQETPPDSFMKKFVEQFRAGTTTPLSLMVDGIYESLIDSAKITANIATSSNVRTYLYQSSLAKHNQLMAGLISLNAYEVSGGITSNMSLFFPEFVSSNLTEEEMIEASAFVPLFQAAFPNPVTANNISQVTLTVPQALGYFGIIMPMDAEEDEDFECTIMGDMYVHYGVNYPYVDDDEMGGMLFNPVMMLVYFGWIDGTESFIENIEFRVNSMHVPETMISTVNGVPVAIVADPAVKASDNGIMWKPVETLGLWFSYSSQTNFPDEARLTYLDSNGSSKTVTFAVQSSGSSYYLESNCWSVFEQWRSDSLPDSALEKIIVDFGECTAYLTLWDDGIQITDVDGDDDTDSDDIISATIMKPDMGSPTMVYPPGPDPVKVTLYGWDNEFSPEEMATNENGVARPLFEWQDPPGAATFLAANSDLSLAYSIEIGMNINKIDWNQPWNPSTNFTTDGDRPITPADSNGWRNIWSSWEDDTWIYGNSFVCPIDLEPTTKNTAANYETRYNVSIRPILIENASRRTVWEGSGIWTEFYVGSVDWTVSLRGTIVFPQKEIMDGMLYNFRPSGQIISTANGSWKIGLFHMSGVESGGWNWQDYFWDGSNSSPRTVTANGAFVVASADITSGSPAYIPYTVPAVTKADALLKKNNEYSLVLWYDIDNDDAVSVNPAVTSWAEFMEPTFRLDMGININNSNLYYWANLDGQHREGDLTVPENQIFNYNFSAKLQEWGWLNFLDNPYDPGVSDDWEDDYGTKITDLGAPEMEFIKDPMVGKSQLRGWYDGNNISSVTASVEAVDYMALVRDWDQLVVATFDLTDTDIIAENSGIYDVSINAIEAAIPGDVTQDSYMLWGMMNTTADPVVVWNSTSAWVDNWFRTEDTAVTYTPDDLMWGFVRQNGLIYVGVRKGASITGNAMTFAIAYNDGSDHILARCSRVNSYAIQLDNSVILANSEDFAGIDTNYYDIFLFGDKNNYPNGTSYYDDINDLSSNGVWDTFISFVRDNPYTPLNVYAFLSVVVNDSVIGSADASGGRFDVTDMSYVQNISSGKIFAKPEIISSALSELGLADPEVIFDTFIDNTINTSVTTLSVYAKADDSVVEIFPPDGTIQTNYSDQFSEGNWEVYGFEDFNASMNSAMSDYISFITTMNTQSQDYYIKAVAGDKTYVGEIQQGYTETYSMAWQNTVTSLNVLMIVDDFEAAPNYIGMASANEDGEIISGTLVVAAPIASANVSTANVNGHDVYLLSFAHADIGGDPTPGGYDMIGAFVSTPDINVEPLGYGVSENIGVSDANDL